MINIFSDSDEQVLKDENEVAKYALDIVLNIANDAIQKRGVFKIVLAGGTTPNKLYSLLAREHCDWHKWQFYFGDERCLAEDDDNKNFTIVDKCLFSSIQNPNIYDIKVSLSKEDAVQHYQQIIKTSLPFDLVILGMGEDGHTASIFPNRTLKNDLVYLVSDSPKPPADRITLSVKALSSNHNLLILITGKSKSNILSKIARGYNPPISIIKSKNKIVLFDKNAYPHNFYK